jgi:hypothetical protein
MTEINPLALEKLNTLKAEFMAAAKEDAFFGIFGSDNNNGIDDAISDVVNDLTSDKDEEPTKSMTGLGKRKDGIHKLKAVKMIFDIKAEDSRKTFRGFFLGLAGKETKQETKYKNYAAKVAEVLKLL